MPTSNTKTPSFMACLFINIFWYTMMLNTNRKEQIKEFAVSEGANLVGIAPEIRPKMQNWISGCDICQDVCPVNRHLIPRKKD